MLISYPVSVYVSMKRKCIEYIYIIYCILNAQKPSGDNRHVEVITEFNYRSQNVVEDAENSETHMQAALHLGATDL
jgi:hypothetical protein